MPHLRLEIRRFWRGATGFKPRWYSSVNTPKNAENCFSAPEHVDAVYSETLTHSSKERIKRTLRESRHQRLCDIVSTAGSTSDSSLVLWQAALKIWF